MVSTVGGPPTDRYDRCVIVPRWVLRIGWAVHRGLHAVSGGRLGVEHPRPDRLGSLRLRTIGRRSGEPRETFLFYVDDGPNLAVVASNAGEDDHPAWYLNLVATAAAEVDLAGDHRPVRARDATPAERDRIYARFEAINRDYAAYRQRATRPIPVVILEPR
jgi:deazaflavin-dependent oxidoreductase (nitroreductase family)